MTIILYIECISDKSVSQVLSTFFLDQKFVVRPSPVCYVRSVKVSKQSIYGSLFLVKQEIVKEHSLTLGEPFTMWVLGFVKRREHLCANFQWNRHQVNARYAMERGKMFCEKSHSIPLFAI